MKWFRVPVGLKKIKEVVRFSLETYSGKEELPFSAFGFKLRFNYFFVFMDQCYIEQVRLQLCV